MMRICIVGNSNSIHIQRWGTWFAQQGHDVHLITTGSTKIEGVTVHHLIKTKNPINFFLRIFKTIRIIHVLKPQIINAHYASGTESFAAALSRYHPIVVSAWGSDIANDPEKSPYFNFVIRYVINHSNIIHTGDQFGKDRLMHLGANEDKIFIMPGSVDLDLFCFNITFMKKPSQYVVLCASPWLPHRNPAILLQTIPYVIKELKDITFIFVGGGSSEDILKATAKKLNIEQYVFFVGKIPHVEMPKYFSISDILVDTDVQGDYAGAGIGITNMEAMACGIPLLLSEREYLRKAGKSLCDESWYCSLVYKPGDSYDLSQKILTLLKDEVLRKTIREKELKIAQEIGDWNKNMQRMEQLFIDLVKK